MTGRYPRIFLAADVARAVDTPADYTKHRAFDIQYYKDFVIKFLLQHRQANPMDFQRLLSNKLSDLYDEFQRKNKIRNLIQEIADCRKVGLPEPDFEQHGPHFVVTLWRNWLTDEVLSGYKLNDRQKQAVKHVKVAGYINNVMYRDLTGTSERTATRELRQLTLAAHIKGVVAGIIDGPATDTEEIAEMGFPLYCQRIPGAKSALTPKFPE